ncbi:MAG: glycerol-3-phosphate dehydrogenase [Pseudomonadota bacterium]
MKISQREDHLVYDVLIIGGGINGAGIARDAAGRGLKVLLCEKDDLASHTSSASTKLIHGGLRYLEHYDFALVRKALIEREVLLNAAPHIIWPLRFVLPHHNDLRPSWLIRLGLFLYDHLGGRKLLPATKTVNRRTDPIFAPLNRTFKKGFEYSDCWVEDSRLVVLNAVDAAERGATIMTRTECVSLNSVGGHWEASLRLDAQSDMTVKAKVVINAAGPWVDQLASRAGVERNAPNVRLVKGSHIIVPKLFDDERCFIFQTGDGRVVFAIPYEDGRFTLIGTTDLPFEGDLNAVEASEEEIAYLCDVSNSYFEKQIQPADVVSTFSGVRPLFDDQAEDASSVTRDYVLKHERCNGASLLSVIGGKITTYRKLAEDALKQLSTAFPELEKEWTAEVPLPGGDIAGANFDAFLQECRTAYPWLDQSTLYRLARTYGTRIHQLLGASRKTADLGRDYGGGLFQAEIDYLVAHEFALSPEDIVMRRTKLGLHMSHDELSTLKHHWENRMVA